MEQHVLEVAGTGELREGAREARELRMHLLEAREPSSDTGPAVPAVTLDPLC